MSLLQQTSISEVTMSRECMEAIRKFKVDKGSVALWWLGQMGYLIKTPGGHFVLRGRLLDELVQEDRRFYRPEYGSAGSHLHRARGTGG